MVNPSSNDWNTFWQAQRKEKILIPSWSKKRIIRVTQPFVAKGKKFLDAGCGSGFFSKHFFDQGLQVTALDYSDGALQMTKDLTKGRTRIIKGDLTSDNITREINGSFDIVFSDGLLEHFETQKQNKIIQNFISLLSPSGVIITFVPNRFSPWEIIRPFFMPGIDETPFVLSALTSLHSQNNLKIIQSGGINTFPFLFSPDRFLGKYFGMLLYTIVAKND